MTDQHISDYEDVTVYTLEDDDELEMLDLQNELTFMWANKEGWPVGVIMSYVFHEGRFWLTASRQRARITAVSRDPRVSVCVTSAGTEMRAGRTVTYKGMCTIHEDDETKAWYYHALAQKLYGADPERARYFEKFLDSPRRVVLEITPTDRIGYDGRKMGQATREAFAAYKAEEEQS
jgi:general stress protein 26